MQREKSSQLGDQALGSVQLDLARRRAAQRRVLRVGGFMLIEQLLDVRLPVPAGANQILLRVFEAVSIEGQLRLRDGDQRLQTVLGGRAGLGERGGELRNAILVR